jgi:hypothetical protein
MENLVEQIKKNRPHLSDSSVRTYKNVITSLYRTLRGEAEMDHHYFTTHQKDVMAHLESVKYNVRKTILSALVALTDGQVQHTYATQMKEDARKYDTLQKEQLMTGIQRANWCKWEEIEETLEKLKKKTDYIWKEKNPSRSDMMLLQKYVLLACYVLIPPRRAMDFCKMKIRDFDKEKDNYYEKGTFYFRQYKTAKFTGLETKKVPKALETLIKKWYSFRDEKLMFSDFMGAELSSSQITKILNSIFGKAISVNMLRHIYLTDKNGPIMAELEERARDMGHSVRQMELYIKKKED